MLKKVLSLILFFSLFLMFLTAMVMYVVPPPRVASWADWSFLGLSRMRWEQAHLGMGLLFLATGVVHLILNWDVLLDHLRDADGVVVVFTKPFFWGLIVTLVVFVGSLAGLPPAHQIVTLSGFIKTRAAEIYGEPPYSLAEQSKLSDFARRMGIEKEKALALLRLRNIKANSADQTLAEIARQNGVAPGGVFEALRMVMEPSGGATSGLPKDPPPGLGRRKLSDICEEYSLDLRTIMARLEAAGIKAKPAWTLTDVASANNVPAITVYEVLREGKNMAPVQVEVPSAPAAPQQPASHTTAAPAQPALPPAQPAQPLPSQTVQSTGRPAPYPSQTVEPQPVPYQPQATVQPAQPAVPVTPPPGLEKMMLQTFCREYNIPLRTAVARLARHRITAFGDMTFEELSLENKRTPSEILRLVTAP